MKASIQWTTAIGAIGVLLWALWEATEEYSEPLALSLPVEARAEMPVTELLPEERVDLSPKTQVSGPESRAEEPDVLLPPRLAWQPPVRYEFRLSGTVHDIWSEPHPEAKVFVAVEGERFTPCAALDSRGRFSLRFEANQVRVSVHIFAVLDGTRARGIETLELVAGESRNINLDLLNLAVKCGGSSPSAAILQGAQVGPVHRVDPGGLTRFVALDNVAPTRPGEPDTIWDEYGGLWRKATRDDDPGEPNCSARGRIMTPTGEFAMGARVRLQNISVGTDLSTTTNQYGQWSFDGLYPGGVSLSAGGDDFGVAHTYANSDRSMPILWDGSLDRGDEVRGRLIGPDDEPLPFLVRGEGSSDYRGSWSDMTVADDHGRFAFPNCTARTMRLFVIDPSVNPLGIPLLVDDTLRRGQAERVLKLKPSALERASVTIRFEDGAGFPVNNAEVRLLHPATNRGVFMKRISSGGVQGHYAASGLPLGTYYLEAIVPELGSVLLDEVDLHIKGDHNLGIHYFDSPGTLRVNHVGPGLDNVVEWRITQRGRVVNALVWAGGTLGQPKRAKSPGGQVHLPTGEYLLSLCTESAGNLSYPFQIASGVETTLDVSYAESSEVTLFFAKRSYRNSLLDEATGLEVSCGTNGRGSSEWTLQLLPGFYRTRSWLGRGSESGTRFEVKASQKLKVAVR